MASRDRERELARAKRDRQLVRRASQEQLRRRILAGVGTLLAVVLVIVGTAALFGAFDHKNDTDAGPACGWSKQDTSANTALKDVGTPPTKGNPTSGTAVMTINTNYGPIAATLDMATAPCGIASLRYLASKAFFNNTKCHELTSTYLTCGDPSGTGKGGPSYSVFGENMPVGEPTASATSTGPAQYPRGTIALVPSLPNSGIYGSQFALVHKDIRTDNPQFATVGFITTGVYLLDRIVKAGTVTGSAGAKTTPAKPVIVTSLTVEGGVGGPVVTITSPPPARPAPTASK